MKPSLSDKVVIVTGASGGIGAAAAAAFVRAGARVALAARDADRLAALARELGGPDRALAVATDVTRAEDCERLARLTAERFGTIDVLVNNAGIGHHTRFDELADADARRIVEVNVVGVMNAVRAVLPWMRRQRRGVIINIASVVAHIGTPFLSVYCASKFAVRGLSQSLRFELAPEGIQVVCFSPAYTETEFFERAVSPTGKWRPGAVKAMTPQAVAERIVAAAVRPRAEVVLSWDGWLLAWGVRHFPRLTAWAARKFFDQRARREGARGR
ncbi:MAG: SDR family NAD(P)-dependent oxidoreductase [Verrucomicrobia bacterium]|nr:SDR family NAD(P)-dependent oxidoreductase [Verrucomicrobiota bacterium]